jgi:hypothetical protein
MSTITDFRAAITGFLANRGTGWHEPRTDPRGTLWLCPPSPAVVAAEKSSADRSEWLHVHQFGAESTLLTIRLDDPDLLEEVGAALDELGV